MKKNAIVFVDFRQFTPFSESLHPYDMIHVLNRYFQEMGKVINQHGGTINNYMVDELMALFGMSFNIRIGVDYGNFVHGNIGEKTAG